MRLPDWLRRQREPAPTSTRARDVLRAVVLGEDVEEVAAALATARELRERDAAERAEVDADRQRREAGARALRRHVEKHGAWFPGDPL